MKRVAVLSTLKKKQERREQGHDEYEAVALLLE